MVKKEEEKRSPDSWPTWATAFNASMAEPMMTKETRRMNTAWDQWLGCIFAYMSRLERNYGQDSSRDVAHTDKRKQRFCRRVTVGTSVAHSPPPPLPSPQSLADDAGQVSVSSARKVRMGEKIDAVGRFRLANGSQLQEAISEFVFERAANECCTEVKHTNNTTLIGTTSPRTRGVI